MRPMMRAKRKTFESQQNEAAHWQMSNELGIVTGHSVTVRVFTKFSHVYRAAQQLELVDPLVSVSQ